TLVAHGFPPGEGVEAGLASERAVREAGAVPATVGVIDGDIVVGLSADELARFDQSARKVGPRDLAAAAVQRAIGATTVGGTLAPRRPARVGARRDGGRGRRDRTSALAAWRRRAAARAAARREPRRRRAVDRARARGRGGRGRARSGRDAVRTRPPASRERRAH